MPQPVDVVVVSYNSSESLRRCIEPLARTSWCHVVVVDNASTDDSLASIDALEVSVVAEEENGGFSRGCNRGWRLGRAPFVLFLNPDCEMRPESVAALIAMLDENDHVGIAGPRIVHHDGSLARSQFRFPRVVSTVSEAFYLHRVWPARSWTSETVSDPRRYEQPNEPEWLSGACLLIRRDLLEQIGGLDESFFMYSEDTELCAAVWSRGYSVRFVPEATIVHEGGGSSPRGELLPTLTSSRLLWFSRNRSRKATMAFRFALALEALTHAVVTAHGRPARRGYLKSIWAALSAPSGSSAM
jgi:GT2 family glycosyltransferase